MFWWRILPYHTAHVFSVFTEYREVGVQKYALYNLKSDNSTINACVGQIKPLVNNSNKATFVELVHIWDLYIRLNKPIDKLINNWIRYILWYFKSFNFFFKLVQAIADIFQNSFFSCRILGKNKQHWTVNLKNKKPLDTQL